MNVRKQAQALKKQMKSGEGAYKPKTFEELNAEVEAMVQETINSVPKFQRREVQSIVYTPAAQNANLPQNNQNGSMTFADALGTVKTELDKNGVDKHKKKETVNKLTNLNSFVKSKVPQEKNNVSQLKDIIADQKAQDEARKSFVGPIQKFPIKLDDETIAPLRDGRIEEIKKQAETDIKNGVRRFKAENDNEQKVYNYFNPLPTAKIGANRPQTKEEKAIYAKEQEKRIQSIDPKDFEQSVKNKFIADHAKQVVRFGDNAITLSPLRQKEIETDAKKYKGTDVTDLKLSKDEQAYRNYISTGIMERAIREQRNKEYEQASPIKEFGMKASDTFSNASLGMYNGMAKIASNFYSALGGFGHFGNNAFTNLADSQDKAAEYAESRSRSLKDNPDSVLNQIIDSTFQSVPRMALDVVLAMMTGGATSANSLAKASLAAIAPNAATTGGYILSSLTNRIGQAIKLPKYMIPMFADQAISSYRDAISDGKPQWQAITFGLTNGYLNALLEGGGIEESFANTAKNRLQQRILSDSDDVLKKAFKTTANKLSPALKEWANSTIEEGLEEVTQSITEKALRNILLQENYGKFFKTGFDNSEDNAFINLREELINFAGGAFGGAAFGGINLASSIVNNQVVNSANKRTAIKNIDREINNTQKYISELEKCVKTDTENKSEYTIQIHAAKDYINDLNRYKSNIKSKNPTAEANLATGTQYESISEFNPNYYDSMAKQYVRADKNENGTYTVKYFDGSYVKKTSGKMYQRYVSVENNESLRNNLNTLINEENRIARKVNNTDVKYSHLYNEDKVSKDFINSVNTDIENAVNEIRNDNADKVPNTIPVTQLNDTATKNISDFSGIDVSDYQCKIERDSLIHIEKRHGLNGTHDQSLSDPKDISRIGYVLNNIDGIEWAKDENGNPIYSKKYNNKDNKPCPVMLVSAKVDGTYVVSQVVPDTKRKTLWVTSARIQKADVGSQVPNTDNGLQHTSETPLNSSSANTSISQNGGNVNRNFAQNTENNSGTVKNGGEKRHFNADYAKSSVREFGQILGVNVEFSDNLGKNVDGMYYTKDGQPTIVIANETTDPIMTVFKHELTHSFQVTDPEAYAEYKKYVIDKLQAYNPEIYKEHFNSLWEKYCKQYNADTRNGRIIKTVKNENGTLNYVTDENGMFVYDGEKRVTAADIEDEIAARATESFLTDEKGIAFQKMADKNPNAAKGFINALRSMILRLVQFSQQLKERFAGAFNTKAETEMLRADINTFREAERMFTDMLEGRYNANPNNVGDTYIDRSAAANDTTADFNAEKIESIVDDIIDYSAKFAGVDNTKVQKIVNAVTSLSNTDLYSGKEISADMRQSVKDNINTLRDSLKNGNLTVKVADGIKYIADMAENTLNSKERFSIQENEKGKYVQADRQVIHSDNDYSKMFEIMNYVKDKVMQGDTLDVTLDDGETISITGRTAWKLADKGHFGDDFYLVKGNAAGVIDEIVQVSKFVNKKDAKKEHSNNFGSKGFEYRNAYFRDLDGKYYMLTLSVGVNESGKEAYNIGKIKEIPFPGKSVSGSKAQKKRYSLDTSIPQNDNSFNSNYMQKSDNYSVENDDKPKFSLAGEKAVTADIKTLDMAKELDKKGVPNEEIYHQTSWFKGADGKWRFEISDKDMELSKFPVYKTHNDGDFEYYTMKLSDVLTHKKLFEAYPEFKDYMLIIQDTDTGVQGINFYKYKQIVLNKELFKRFTKEYRDFLNGGRKSRIAEIEQTSEYKEYQKFYDMTDDEISDIQEWLDEEKIARDKFFNSDLGKEYYHLNWGKPNIKKFELGFTERAKSVIAHEIQHSIQEIEGFATGSSPKYWKRNPRFKDESKIREYEIKLKKVENKFKKIWDDDINLNLAKEYCNMEDVLSDKAVAIENLAEKGGWYDLLSDYAEANAELKFEKERGMQNPELLYQNTAGEIEARDVERRIELSDEERRNTFPESAKENPDRVFADKTMTEDKDVKFSLADNADVTHSQNFKDWFGDWENNPETASKIVNEDGTPKVMYHGSPNDFSVFDLKKARYSGTFGKGFYFTDSNSHASTYGNLYEVYLDVKNPVEGGIPVNKKQLEKFIAAVADNEDYSIENYGTYDINTILTRINKANLFTALRDINSTAIGDFVEAVKLYNKVNGTNYDGIISDTETVVFSPNQIKSATDNIGTFDKNNPDIKFSLADDSDTSGIFTPNKTEAQRYNAQVDEWINGKMKSSDLFKLGRTPVVLRELGARDLPIVMSQDVMVKVTGGKHSISLDELKQLPKAIADPIMAFKSATVNNAYVILTELTDKYGNDVVVAMHVNRWYNENRINRIASVYGKENVGNFVKEQIEVGNLRYIDKNKSQEWSIRRGLQLPKLNTIPDFNNSILQKEDIVNRYSAQNTNKNTVNMNKTDPDKHIIDKIVSGKEPKLSLKEEKAYKRLEDTNKLLREHFKLTPGEKVTEEHALNLAKKYVKQYGLVYDTADYANKIKEVINHEAGNVKNKNSEYNIFDELQAVNAEMLETAKALDTTISDQYKDLAATLKKGVQVSDEMKSNITDYKDFKASVRNSLTLKKDNGADVDKLYQELAEQYPEFFGNDIINPVDRLFKLAEVSQAIKPQIITPEYGTASIKDIADIITAEMLDELTPQTKMGKRVNELKYKLGETKRAMRAQKTHLKREGDLRVAFAVDKESAKLDKYKAERKNKAAREYLFKALDKLSKMDTQSINNKKSDGARKSLSNEIARINEAIEKNTEKLGGNLSDMERTKIQRHLAMLKNMLAKKSAVLKNLGDMKENGVDFEAQKAELMRNITAVAQSNIDSAVAEINNLIAEQNKKISELKEKLGGNLPQNVLEQTGKKIKALEAKRDKLLQQASNKQNEGGDNINVYKALKESDIDTLTDFTKDVLNLQNDIRTYGKALKNAKTADLHAIADKIAREQEDYAKLRSKNGNKKNTFAESLKTRIMFDVLSPMRVARMVSGYNENAELMRIFNDINAGQEDVRKFKYQANKMFEDAFKDAKISLIDTINKLSGRRADTVKFKADGKEYEITKGMRISLYLHSLNKSNMFHIEHGGIIIPNIKEFKKGNPKAFDNDFRSESIKLTAEDVRGIISGMSKEEKLYAQVAHKFFNEKAKNAINARSEYLVGYDIADVTDYFPIVTERTVSDIMLDKNPLLSSMYMDSTGEYKEDKSGIASIEGRGEYKSRVKGSSTPIMLEDVYSVVKRHIKNTAQYYGMSMPLRNLTEVLNTFTFSDGRFKTVSAILEKHWGSGFTKWLTNLRKDLNFGRKNESDTIIGKVTDKLTGNYAGAVLTGNLSVILKQTASYPTAIAELGPEAIARGFADMSKITDEFINSLTGIYAARGNGVSDVSFEDVLKENPIVQKSPTVLRAFAKGIEAADKITVKKLFKAAMWSVKLSDSQYKNMDMKTAMQNDDFKAKVVDAYIRTVENTQPMYDTMQRNVIQRTPDKLAKFLFPFMTQRFQNLGIMLDAVGNYKAKRLEYKTNKSSTAEANLKEARKRFIWAVQSRLIANVMMTGINALWKMLRDRTSEWKDDDDKTDKSKVMAWSIDDFLKNNIGDIPLGGTVYDVITTTGEYIANAFLDKYDSDFKFDVKLGYSYIDEVEIASVNLLNEIFQIPIYFAQNAGKRTVIDNIISNTTVVSRTIGVPADSVKNIYLVTLNTIRQGRKLLGMDTTEYDFRAKSLEWKVNEKNASKFYEYSNRAFLNYLKSGKKSDLKIYNDISDELIKGGISQDKIESKAYKYAFDKNEVLSNVINDDKYFNRLLKQVEVSVLPKYADTDTENKATSGLVKKFTELQYKDFEKSFNSELKNIAKDKGTFDASSGKWENSGRSMIEAYVAAELKSRLKQYYGYADKEGNKNGEVIQADFDKYVKLKKSGEYKEANSIEKHLNACGYATELKKYLRKNK